MASVNNARGTAAKNFQKSAARSDDVDRDNDLAESDLVTGSDKLALDAIAVDHCAVGRTQVFNPDLIVLQQEACVSP